MLGHKVALINEADLVNSWRVLSGERIDQRLANVNVPIRTVAPPSDHGKSYNFPWLSRPAQRLANVNVPIHTVTPPSDYDNPKTCHSGHLAITVILRGPDGDRYGQVLLYI